MKIAKEYKIRYNSHSKRHVIFEVPTKGGWRIKTSFKSKSDAEDWIKAR